MVDLISSQVISNAEAYAASTDDPLFKNLIPDAATQAFFSNATSTASSVLNLLQTLGAAALRENARVPNSSLLRTYPAPSIVFDSQNNQFNYSVTLSFESPQYQGSVYSLSDDISSLGGPSITFDSLLAEYALNAPVSGQSNAERMVSNGFLTNTEAATDAQVNLINSTSGGTGFEAGDGAWQVHGTLAQNYVTALNAAKAAADDDTFWGPHHWWQIEKDANALSSITYYKDQFLNFKRFVEQETGLKLPWLFFQLNDDATVTFNTEARAIINEIVAENPDIYLVTTDDLPLSDGLHYTAVEYEIAAQRARSVIEANSLIQPNNQVEFTHTPPTASGIVYDATFTGAPDLPAENFVPAVGDAITELNGQLALNAAGDGLIVLSPDPGGAKWLAGIPNNATGVITRVEAVLKIPGGSSGSTGVLLRTNLSNLDHLAILVFGSGEARLFRYLDGYGSGANVTEPSPGDDLHTLIVEYSADRVTWSINGAAVVTIDHSFLPFSNDVGLRIGSGSHEVKSLKVIGQDSFTI